MSEDTWDQDISYREPYDGDRQVPAEVYEDSYTGIDHRVIITCDSVLKRRTRWSLYVKYGRPPRRVACPVCGRKARAELEQDEPDWEPGPGWAARSWAHLSYPFRGGYADG